MGDGSGVGWIVAPGAAEEDGEKREGAHEDSRGDTDIIQPFVPSINQEQP